MGEGNLIRRKSGIISTGYIVWDRVPSPKKVIKLCHYYMYLVLEMLDFLSNSL